MTVKNTIAALCVYTNDRSSFNLKQKPYNTSGYETIPDYNNRSNDITTNRQQNARYKKKENTNKRLIYLFTLFTKTDS